MCAISISYPFPNGTDKNVKQPRHTHCLHDFVIYQCNVHGDVHTNAQTLTHARPILFACITCVYMRRRVYRDKVTALYILTCTHAYTRRIILFSTDSRLDSPIRMSFLSIADVMDALLRSYGFCYYNICELRHI